MSATKAAKKAGGTGEDGGAGINVEISGDHIIQAYKTVRDDLTAMFQDDPDRRVEFVIGNNTDLKWENLSTHCWAGEWVRGANPSEDLAPHHAIGAAIESDGGGAGGALAFRCDLPVTKDSVVQVSALLVIFGYCPKTASDRVEGHLYSFPTVAVDAFIGDINEWVEDQCEALEDLGGHDTSWSSSFAHGSLKLNVTSRYSGGNNGYVATTISYE